MKISALGLTLALVVPSASTGDAVAWAKERSGSTRENLAPSAAALVPGQIDTATSRVYVLVEKKGLGHPHGVVGRLKEGFLRVAPKSAGRIVFDMSSFAVDPSEARRYVGLRGEIEEGTQQQVTQTMLGAEVLDVGQFPTAVFNVDSLKPLGIRSELGKPQYRLEGKLTLRGVTNPVEINVSGTERNGMLRIEGSFSLQQTTYKIRPFKKALGAVGVADVLTVYGDIWVKKDS